MGFIEEAARKGDAKNLKLHDIAKKVGLTPRYFHKIFKDKTGTTPREYTNIIAAQHSSTSPSSGSRTSPCNAENFDWDTFDIAELAQYQFDSNQTLEGDFLTQAAQITAAGFGETPAQGLPLLTWSASSPECDNSETDSTLSGEHLIGFGGWEPASTGVEQCQNTAPLLDPTFDFDLTMCMAFLDDHQATTPDMAPIFETNFAPNHLV
ncbi:hypothetical protein E8E13_008286 [Curvularia kusanoi]|uniref:HTH araC/xylS-type domain-containing protein n=1 Tax=Curvularia kusanoi TaxID=90978 RepID=A0A9P4WBI0_CURKU|nr:hypothetical protein E8E13_008286 [Curvularia kusanoi]